jgi:outer membrane protein TolC
MAILAGCSTFSKDGGFDTVSATAKTRLGKEAVLVKTDADRDAVEKRTRALLAKPLSMDDAVQVALLNNRGLQATADVRLKVATDARRAYIDAVAADQAANYAKQVQDSAGAGAELAERMRRAGNFSKLDAAREQAFYAESVVQAAKAHQRAVAAREKLTRTMGLSGAEATYKLPDRLPDLPKERPNLKKLEAFAMQSRLAQTAIDARSEVRESYSAYVTSYDVAKRYRDEIVPLRKTISDELLLRYNGMLASTFELLADSREQMGAVNGYIDSLKDYWLADTDLRMAVGGHLPSSSAEQAVEGAAVQGTADDALTRPAQSNASPTAKPASSTNSERN